MNSAQMTKADGHSLPTISHVLSVKSGRQRQGRLWSNLKEVCDLLRLNISLNENIAHDEVMFHHKQYKAGQRIFHMGQVFDKLYIVNSGFLKTVVVDNHGNEQVLGFPMRSDLLGMDGIHSSQHASEAVALSDCDLIILPYRKLVALGRTHAELEYALYGLMSRELMREQALSVLLGSMCAEVRVTQFLLSMSERFGLMGYSSKIFNLRMTRHEIGSYLGLTLETVSRTMSALGELGYIFVDQKSIELIDIDALKSLRKPLAMSRTKKKMGKAKIAPDLSFTQPGHWENGEVCAAS